MNNNPLISVIVPCRNAEKYLSNCFASLDNQTYKNVQYILVNDGSTDNTEKLLLEHASTNRNYLILNTFGTGVAAARNCGIENSSGEYVTFVDSDDIISPYHVENLFKCLRANDADVAVCSYKKVKDGKNYKEYNFTPPPTHTEKQYSQIELYDRINAVKQFLAQKKFDYSVWNKLYSSKIIKENNIRFMFGCRYNEDSLFNYKYLKHVDKAVFINFPTHFYVQRKNSLVHLPFNEYRLDAYKSLNAIIKDSEEKHPEFVHYAHAIRACLSCEIIYFIKKSAYSNGKVISKIIEYLQKDAPHLKYCKKLHLYRRLFIPLVPKVSKLLLCKRRKNLSDGFLLPDFMI